MSKRYNSNRINSVKKIRGRRILNMTPEQWYKIIYQKAVSLLEEEKNIYWGEKKQSERIEM